MNKSTLNQRLCSVEGCDHEYYAKGFCSMHYKKNRKYGDPLKFVIYISNSGLCEIDGCINKHYSKGLCNLHWFRKWRHGTTDNLHLLRNHGKSNDSIYRIWKGMKNRCNNHGNDNYIRYGARGIRVCTRWLSFKNFYEDMGDKPKGMSLDRIDNNGDYCKKNCRWATRKQQQRNMRSNHFIAYRGREQCISAWAEELGVGWKNVEKLLLNST